ncbi:5998_t:CDS:2, partial [Paraglomus brasilianum]
QIVEQLEQEIKEINQELGIDDKTDAPKPNPGKPTKNPQSPKERDNDLPNKDKGDNPKPTHNPDKTPPPSNNLEAERTRLINELEKSCEEKQPKLPKKAIKKFVKQIENASLTELPAIFQQAEERAKKRGTSIEEITGSYDIRKLVEKIKPFSSLSSSPAKLTEGEVKKIFPADIPFTDTTNFIRGIIRASKEKLRKSNFPEFLLIIDRVKLEFTQTNADIESSFKDMEFIPSSSNVVKEDEYIKWVDKLGVEFKLKTSPALLITPYYLEDDNSQSYDYSQMAEEKLKEEIKSTRFFDEESKEKWKKLELIRNLATNPLISLMKKLPKEKPKKKEKIDLVNWGVN